MSKRKSATTSSSSNFGEGYNTDGNQQSSNFELVWKGGTMRFVKSSSTNLSNGHGSRKKARTGSTQQGRNSPVASTSTQLPPERVITFKDDEEVGWVENEVTQVVVDDREGSNRSAGPRRSTRERVSSKYPPPSQENQKYFEGCLVMARDSDDYSLLLPGMIRRAGSDDEHHPDYICKPDKNTWYFVQFFINPTIGDWRIPRDVKVYETATPAQKRCKNRDPAVVQNFENGMKILKAALDFPVEARLAKFSLAAKASTTGLLKAIDVWNSQGGSVAQNEAPTTELENDILNSQNASRDDLVAEQENDPTSPLTQGNGRISQDSVDQNEGEIMEIACPARGKKTCITDVVAGLKKKQTEILKKKDQEKEEAVRALQAALKKVKETNKDLTRQLQIKDGESGKIKSLEEELKDKDKMIEEIRKEIKKTNKEKQECEEEMQKMRSEVESLRELFNDE